MSDRQVRRAAEREAFKEARKASSLKSQPIRSRRNSPLRGAFRVLPTEGAAAFERLLNELHREHDPRSATEDILVNGTRPAPPADARSLRLQDELFPTGDLSEPTIQKDLALYIRY